MAGKTKTKAELQAELDQAHDLIGALTDLLGAVSTLAAHEPRPASYSDSRYLGHLQDLVSDIKVWTEPDDHFGDADMVLRYAAKLHEKADKPVRYAVYQEDHASASA